MGVRRNEGMRKTKADLEHRDSTDRRLASPRSRPLSPSTAVDRTSHEDHPSAHVYQIPVVLLPEPVANRPLSTGNMETSRVPSSRPWRSPGDRFQLPSRRVVKDPPDVDLDVGVALRRPSRLGPWKRAACGRRHSDVLTLCSPSASSQVWKAFAKVTQLTKTTPTAILDHLTVNHQPSPFGDQTEDNEGIPSPKCRGGVVRSPRSERELVVTPAYPWRIPGHPIVTDESLGAAPAQRGAFHRRTSTGRRVSCESGRLLSSLYKSRCFLLSPSLLSLASLPHIASVLQSITTASRLQQPTSTIPETKTTMHASLSVLLAALSAVAVTAGPLQRRQLPAGAPDCANRCLATKVSESQWAFFLCSVTTRTSAVQVTLALRRQVVVWLL